MKGLGNWKAPLAGGRKRGQAQVRLEMFLGWTASCRALQRGLQEQHPDVQRDKGTQIIKTPQGGSLEGWDGRSINWLPASHGHVRTLR